MARLTKTLKNTLKKYDITAFPTDKRTKEYRQALKDFKVDEEGYVRILKKQIKKVKKREEINKKTIQNFFNDINTQLSNLSIAGANIKIDLSEIQGLELPAETLRDIIKNVYRNAFNYKTPNTRIIYSGSDRKKIYTLSLKNMENIDSYFDDKIQIQNKTKKGSDANSVSEYVIKADNYIYFSSIEKTNIYNTAEGAYFPYYHKLNADLSRYLIFNNNEGVDFTKNCLVYSLEQLNMEFEKIEKVKTYITKGYFSKSNFKKLCEEIDVIIELFEDKKGDIKTNQRKTIFKPSIITNETPIYKIALIENHYFIYEFINIEPFNKNLSTLVIVRKLLENKDKYLETINYFNINEQQEKTIHINYDDNLRFIAKIATRDKKPVKNKINEYRIIFADFETFTEEINDKLVHIPYLLVIKYDNTKEIIRYEGYTCVERFLDDLEKKDDKHIQMIFHNAKYDMNFLTSHLKIANEINSEGHFKSLIGYTKKGIEIFIKCSYNLFSLKLADCVDAFLTKEEQKKIKKEIMPYNFYKRETINERWVDLDKIKIDYFKNEDDYNGFLNNINEWGLYNKYLNKVDIIKYASIYCVGDVEILEKSYNKFKEWCLNDFNINIDNYLTISSIADAYFNLNNCYEGVKEISMNVRDFIQKSVYGGRVMISNNQKKIVSGIINDFDAVSLYPSAMRRLSYPKGIPKILNKDELNLEFLEKTDAYFIQIKITKVGVKRSFPIMSKDYEDKRNYTNDMVGEILVVNNITLEDLIKYHKIEFEIIKGYYFNEGTNDNIQEIIQYLFDKRKKLKKEDNQAEIIYKLLMNSAYGKTIQKKYNNDLKFIYGEKEINSYISKNYNKINVGTYLNTSNNKKACRFEIEKTQDDHYNLAHVGSLILAMSKRIMNEVMCLAEDNSIELFYQDTDSIHLYDKDIEKLQKIFKDNYNRDLIGKDLGQFHSDFKSKKIPKGLDIYSKKLIALGKKCYLDVLEAVDKKGKVYNDYHIRLKGVSCQSIEYTAKKRNQSIEQLYMDLYKGDKIEFDLTCGGKKPCFKFFKNYEVITQINFTREIQFKKV